MVNKINEESTKAMLSIRKEVSKATLISEEIMCRKGRKREVVIARQLTCYLSFHFVKNVSLNDIAETLEFPNYDHRMIIYCRETIENLMCSDSNIRKVVVELEEVIKNNGIVIPPYARNWNGKWDYELKID